MAPFFKFAHICVCSFITITRKIMRKNSQCWKIHRKRPKKHTHVTKSNLLQLFCDEYSPIHSLLHENTCTKEMKGSLFAFFHFCHVSVFFRSVVNWNEVLQKLFPYFVFSPRFSKPPSKWKTNTFIELEPKVFLRGGRMHLALATNALVLEANAFKTRLQTSALHSHIHIQLHI